MNRPQNARQRPVAQVSLSRAARLRHFVLLLAPGPQNRQEIVRRLGIGLRTFYRELELIQRCGIAVRSKDGAYVLMTSVETAEGRLPFPDPHFCFAEMAELSRSPGAAGRRLAELMARVLQEPGPNARKSRKRTLEAAALQPSK